MRGQLDVGIVVGVRGAAGLGRLRLPRAARTAARPQRGVRAAVCARARQDARRIHLRAMEGAHRRARARQLHHRQGLSRARRQPYRGRAEEQKCYAGIA